MVIAKFTGLPCCIARGLVQWDYGQELAIENAKVDIPDGTEINFYQKSLSSIAYIKNRHVLIPDLMLQNSEDITAYIYVRSETSGETVLSISLPVKQRPRPENYILPEYEEYKRLMPPGGDDNQILAKRSDEDYDTEWKDPDDAQLAEMSDAEIDALFEED